LTLNPLKISEGWEGRAGIVVVATPLANAVGRQASRGAASNKIAGREIVCRDGPARILGL